MPTTNVSSASSKPRFRTALSLFGAMSFLAMASATAQVPTATTGADPTGDYRSERASCMTGRTQQAQATCLEEARNAAADKRRGVLDNSGGDYAANQSRRCEVFRDAEDRAACTARIQGEGAASGTVAGGGVIREVETIVLPAGQRNVRIEPKTADPVILVPVRTNNR